MSSHRRSPDRPIESVVLRVTFRADRDTIDRIREAVPSAVLKDGACEIVVRGGGPSEVAERAKEILEKVRAIVRPTKGFKWRKEATTPS